MNGIPEQAYKAIRKGRRSEEQERNFSQEDKLITKPDRMYETERMIKMRKVSKWGMRTNNEHQPDHFMVKSKVNKP